LPKLVTEGMTKNYGKQRMQWLRKANNSHHKWPERKILGDA